jgi:glyoxylase-like metal-dependent hydrolase (beta-lactamase superfamily II)
LKNQTIALGDFGLTALSDGTYVADGGAFFGIIPKVMWQRKVPADDLNRIKVSCNSVLVRTGKQTVLIETGIGNKISERIKGFYLPEQKLMDSLRETGTKPEEIDVVINSHLHFDHCGWNTVYKDGMAVATFPNARYFAPKGEWEHGKLQTERDRISYISDNYDPVIRSGQMTLLGGNQEQEIVPGISVEVWPGHTRNMWAVFVRSGGKTACYISDLIPTTWHLEPTWSMAYDLFPMEVLDNRKRYYARAIPEKWLTMFTHDPHVPWAYLDKADGKLAFKTV